MKREASSKPKAKKSPIRVTSIADLQKACEQILVVQFDLGENTYQIDVRRLNPKEDAAIESIINAVVPPVLKGAKPEEDRLNYYAPEYMKAKAEAEIKARAVALYWCVPIFQKEKPDLVEQPHIVEFIQSKFNHAILDILWQAVREPGVKLAQLVNFTSSSTSQAT